MPKKSATEPVVVSVVVFGDLHQGYRWAPIDAKGDRGEPSEPYPDQPDCLSAAWTANPGVVVRLAE